jgi:hypothetical protein
MCVDRHIIHIYNNQIRSDSAYFSEYDQALLIDTGN